jgi:hypothetical protein
VTLHGFRQTLDTDQVFLHSKIRDCAADRQLQLSVSSFDISSVISRKLHRNSEDVFRRQTFKIRVLDY